MIVLMYELPFERLAYLIVLKLLLVRNTLLKRFAQQNPPLFFVLYWFLESLIL